MTLSIVILHQMHADPCAGPSHLWCDAIASSNDLRMSKGDVNLEVRFFFFRSLWVMAGSILGYWKAYYARAWVHLIFSIFGGFKVKQQTWWLLNLLFFHFILSKVSSEGILINFYFFGLYNKIKPTLPCLLRVFFIPYLLQDIYLFFTNNI